MEFKGLLKKNDHKDGQEADKEKQSVGVCLLYSRDNYIHFKLIKLNTALYHGKNNHRIIYVPVNFFVKSVVQYL